MPEANDAAMQKFFNERIRPAAERFGSFLEEVADDKAMIGEVYARATGSTGWTDARNDVPTVARSGNGANPDHALSYNAFVTALLAIVNGTDNANDAANAAAVRSNWAVVQTMKVNPSEN